MADRYTIRGGDDEVIGAVYFAKTPAFQQGRWFASNADGDCVVAGMDTRESAEECLRSYLKRQEGNDD